MTDLNTHANLADIVSGAVVVGGAAFAVIQLREYRRRRRENVAAGLTWRSSLCETTEPSPCQLFDSRYEGSPS